MANVRLQFIYESAVPDTSYQCLCHCIVTIYLKCITYSYSSIIIICLIYMYYRVVRQNKLITVPVYMKTFKPREPKWLW